MKDTDEMLKAAKYSSIGHVRSRVRFLMREAMDPSNDEHTRLMSLFCLEPYGITLAGTENAPTAIEYAEFVNSLSGIAQEPDASCAGGDDNV